MEQCDQRWVNRPRDRKAKSEMPDPRQPPPKVDPNVPEVADEKAWVPGKLGGAEAQAKKTTRDAVHLVPRNQRYFGRTA